MLEINQDLLSKSVKETLRSFFSGLSEEMTTLLNSIVDDILSNLPQYTQISDFSGPAKKVETLFSKKASSYSNNDKVVLRRALVAKLAINLPEMVNHMALPDSILALYPDAFGRLADFLKSLDNDPYDSTGEFFCKDIRFTLALSIPNGACVLDIDSHVPLPSVILSVFRSKKVYGMIQYFRSGGTGTWFRGHLDSRYVKEWNEQGIDNFYLRVAELLEQQINIRGYVGTSWVFDPQLVEISPRQAFIQERPRERGAFFLQHGTERSDLEFALKTSETRRRLYQEGKYIPVCYSMVWPRKDLIAWAKKASAYPHI